jgi:hypothetical protein
MVLRPFAKAGHSHGPGHGGRIQRGGNRIGDEEKERIDGFASLAVPEESTSTRKAAGTAWAPAACLNRRRPSRRPLTGG